MHVTVTLVAAAVAVLGSHTTSRRFVRARGVTVAAATALATTL
jgi:hypothetical protein